MEALEKSELNPQELVKGDYKVCLMVKIYGDIIYDKLKRFTSQLNKYKLKYNSSFSPKGGIMNITVF